MSGGFPRIDASLHQPSRSGVPHNVWRDLTIAVVESSDLQNLRPRVPHTIERNAAVLADVHSLGSIEPTPAPQMRQDAAAELHNRCPLVLALIGARRPAPHGTGVEVYPVPPQVSDYTAAGAGIDTKQDKPGDARPAAGAGTSSRIQRVRGSGFGGSTI
jgi:hypothetical protein